MLKLICALIFGISLSAFADRLFFVQTNEYTQSGLNQKYVGDHKVYLLLKDDSSFVKSTFPVNGFGQLALAISTKKGTWKISDDSIRLNVSTCNSSYGTCNKDGIKYSFHGDSLNGPESKLLNINEKSELITRLNKSETETSTRSNSDAVILVLLVGVLIAMIAVAK